jgi:hypothetical protein
MAGRKPQNKRKRNILPDTLIRKAIVVFGINEIFRAAKESPLLRASGGVYGQHLPYRVFPQGTDVFLRNGQVVAVFSP